MAVAHDPAEHPNTLLRVRLSPGLIASSTHAQALAHGPVAHGLVLPVRVLPADHKPPIAHAVTKAASAARALKASNTVVLHRGHRCKVAWAMAL